MLTKYKFSLMTITSTHFRICEICEIGHRDDIGDSRVRIPLNIKTIGDYEAMIRLFGLDDSGIAL